MLKKLSPLIQYIVSPSCINCGSFYKFKNLLCLICQKKFNQIQLNQIQVRHLENIVVQYYYLWTNDSSKLNKKIIYSLKSKYSLAYWQKYCEHLRILKNEIAPATLLVPVPSADANRFHTRHMSYVLGHLWEKPVGECLTKKIQTVEQKQQLTVADRQKIEFVADPIINTWVNHQRITRIIILDDVVTSGATLNAVYKALKDVLEDKNILISAVCLFSRE